jgi:hypothetical protein
LAKYQLHVREIGPLSWEWRIVDGRGKVVASEGGFSFRNDAEQSGKARLLELETPGTWEDVT